MGKFIMSTNEIEINATRAEERMECGAPETKKTSGAARRRHIDGTFR